MNMTFEKPQINKKDIPEKKEWGQKIEKEIFIPFLTKTMGDIFDFAVKTSEDVDNNPYGPKIDIIARFRQDGSHLAIDSTALELNDKGREILEEKKSGARFKSMWGIERICKDSGYLPKSKDERTPKIVLNFNHNAISDAQAFWTHEGRKKSWFEYLNLDRNVNDEGKRKEEKERWDFKDRIDILQQMIEGLEDILESKRGQKEEKITENIINPKLEILRRALARNLKANLTPLEVYDY